MRDELLQPEAADDEAPFEAGLRPRHLDEFVGQPDLKRRLGVVLGAARKRGHAAEHMLFAGPPGLGKTTLAGIVAAEMEAPFHITSGPALERTGDLAAILAKCEPHSVLFIDEIHRLARPVEEVLYPAMEDFELDLVMGKGAGADTIRIDLPPFTLIGATTRTGLITGPLRDRFGLVERLEFYEVDDLRSIVERAATILEVSVDRGGAHEIARRSRGTPRIANRLLRQVRDFAEVERDGHIDAAVACEGLAFFGIDDLGLDRPTLAILDAVCRRFGGGPVGLKTLSIGVSEPTETVEDVYEPYLIQLGLLMRTPQGRIATPAAWAHLGMTPPTGSGGAASLFG